LIAPNVVLTRCRARRQRTILEDFPDALDLLIVCIEAGLGMDAALMRVANEISISSPAVASELQLMLLEMRSGFTKEKALCDLALRTGVEDIDMFASMLIQAERFGTSIGASLRVISDTLRTRRRMRAEERAAKIALKLLFPLIFCLFPALLTVLLGPAFIHVYRVLLPPLSATGEIQECLFFACPGGPKRQFGKDRGTSFPRRYTGYRKHLPFLSPYHKVRSAGMRR
jgi:tight adherence protein C